MKKTVVSIIFAAVALFALVLPGCIMPGQVVGEGAIETRDYQYSGFTGIDIGYAFDLEVIPGDSYNIEITAHENIFEHIEVTKSGSTLRIKLRNILSVLDSSLKATIVMPELEKLELSGAVSGSALGFESTGDFDLELSGASSLDIDLETGDIDMAISGASRLRGRLVADDLRIELSGASSLELEGAGEDAILEVSGASRLILVEYPLDTADMEVSGASRAEVDVRDWINIKLSGASTLIYNDDADLRTVDVSGASTIRTR